MIPAEVPFDASATLLWFPSGQVPSDADFKPQDIDPRAETYWFRHEAVVEAVEAAINGRRPNGRDPWIKYASGVLDEAAIRLQYERAKKITG